MIEFHRSRAGHLLFPAGEHVVREADRTRNARGAEAWRCDIGVRKAVTIALVPEARRDCWT